MYQNSRFVFVATQEFQETVLRDYYKHLRNIGVEEFDTYHSTSNLILKTNPLTDHVHIWFVKNQFTDFNFYD